MASQLQIDANRRNSQLSTGPRTPEGKAVSRLNALKSGIHAQAQVIPGEDAAELEALAQAYHGQFQPANPLECFLVDSLIHADWQLRRLHRLEAQLWASPGDAPLGDTYTQSLDIFTRLQRRIDSTERSYYRALSQLQRQQKAASPAVPSQAIEESAPCPELASFRENPPGPFPADDLPHSASAVTPCPLTIPRFLDTDYQSGKGPRSFGGGL